MTAPPAWRLRSVFISSTFRDTHAERDWLRQRTFPELEERLRALRCRIEPIDLRWGVDTTQTAQHDAKQLLILKVCLAEVERSRPFFLAILGDRYGWIPPAQRLQAAAREAGLPEPDVGRSVTELEIDFGVLASPSQRHRCFFYFRKPLPYHEMPPKEAALYSDAYGGTPEAEAAVERLTQLKTRISKQFPNRVRFYDAAWDSGRQMVTGLEQWGHQVLEDLWSAFTTGAGLAEDPATAPAIHDPERFAIEEFIEDRARGFVGRERLVQQLVAFAASTTDSDAPWGTCVTGSPGTGKSALFAMLNRTLGTNAPLVLSHAVGITPNSSRVDAMLRRWCEDLGASLGERTFDGEIPLEHAFAHLLRRASARRRVVLLMDALEQLESTPRARHWTWLPKPWPPNVCLVAMAVPGPSSQPLIELPGVRHIELSPLEPNEAAAIARSLCARYRRTLSDQVLRKLMSKRDRDGRPACGNALWLTLAVEELNLLDADDFARLERDFSGSAEERILGLLEAVVDSMPGDVPQLYEWLLERAEALHGRLAPAVVELLALGRAGWRDFDLRSLVPQQTGQPWDDLSFAALRRTLRAHLVQRGVNSQWAFAHRQLQVAVLNRHLADAARAKELHDRIARHLETLPREDPVHESETMVHLVRAHADLRAARFYASNLSPGEAAGAAAALTDEMLSRGGDTDVTPARVASLVGTAGLSETETDTLAQRLLLNVGDNLRSAGATTVQFDLTAVIEASLSKFVARRPTIVKWQATLSIAREKMGDLLLMERGDSEAALRLYRANLETAENLAKAYPDSLFLRHDVAASFEKVGDALLRRGDSTGALDAYHVMVATHEALAQAGWRPSQTVVSAAHNKVGDALFSRADFPDALISYRRGLAVAREIAGLEPDNPTAQRDLGVALERVGSSLRMLRDYRASLEMHRECLAIAEKRALADPDDRTRQAELGGALEHVATGQAFVGDLSEALRFAQSARAVRAKLTRIDPENLQWARDLATNDERVGDFCAALGHMPAALEAYQSSLTISERLSQIDPARADWRRSLVLMRARIARVLGSQGDRAVAVRWYRAALDEAKALSAADPRNATWQRDAFSAYADLGDALAAAGDWHGALEAYRVARPIGERLSARDPGDVHLRLSLASIAEGIGLALREAKNFAGAATEFRQAVALCDRAGAVDENAHHIWYRLLVLNTRLADTLDDLGERKRAVQSYRTAVSFGDRLLALNRSEQPWQYELSQTHEHFGFVLAALNDLGGALMAYETAVALRQTLVQARNAKPLERRDFALLLFKTASVLVRQERMEAATRLLTRCRVLLQELHRAGIDIGPDAARILQRLTAEFD
jgi:tetratricopeptide (TPR) repeat protein